MSMNSASTLARLIAQAEQQGADLLMLRAIAEEASECGAERALAALGLSDAGAQRDVDQLRQLLQAWRDAKKSAASAVIEWVVRILLLLLVLGLAVRVGLWEKLV